MDGPKLRALLSYIHRQARTASTTEQCTQAINGCRQIRKLSVSDRTLTYVDALEAWIHNRRGEFISKQATQLAAKGFAEQAMESEEKAIEDYSRAIELNPKAWNARHNRAVSLGIRGDHENAIADLNEVLSLRPDFTKGRFNRAELLLQLERYEEAIRDYVQVLEHQPDDLDALIGLNHARSQTGDHDTALGELTEAMARFPRNAELYVERGDIWTARQEWERAAMDYQQATRLDAQSPRTYHSLAWLMATCPDKRFRNPALALRAAERALQLGGNDYRYLDALAAAKAASGEFQSAKVTLAEAIEIAPQDETEALQHRLALYERSKPFHQATHALHLARFE